MNIIKKATLHLCWACDDNPISTTAVVFLAMLFFNIIEATIEKLIFGERFEHWLDPIFMGCFIAWASYAVYMCSLIKLARTEGKKQ